MIMSHSQARKMKSLTAATVFKRKKFGFWA
jgi:hypothetical protein